MLSNGLVVIVYHKMPNSSVGFQRKVLTELMSLNKKLDGVVARREDLSLTQMTTLEEFEEFELQLQDKMEREALVSEKIYNCLC